MPGIDGRRQTQAPHLVAQRARRCRDQRARPCRADAASRLSSERSAPLTSAVWLT